MTDSKQCHDCGVLIDENHHDGCDMEECPFCHGQLISCNCCYVKLDLLNYKKYPSAGGLPPEIYENGLPDDLAYKWDEMLEEKGFIPYGSEKRFKT